MYDFICENGRVEDSGLEALLNSKAQSGMISYRQYTTGIFCDGFSSTVDDAAHLLEIRLFNENAEIRASRPEIGMPFTWRIIDDSRFREALSGDETFEDRTYTEQQYLDIDSTKSFGRNYTATGGGHYTLPVENAEKLEIRNYCIYDDNGILKIVDFRIVRILAKGEQ